MVAISKENDCARRGLGTRRACRLQFWPGSKFRSFQNRWPLANWRRVVSEKL